MLAACSTPPVVLTNRDSVPRGYLDTASWGILGPDFGETTGPVSPVVGIRVRTGNVLKRMSLHIYTSYSAPSSNPLSRNLARTCCHYSGPKGPRAQIITIPNTGAIENTGYSGPVRKAFGG